MEKDKNRRQKKKRHQKEESFKAKKDNELLANHTFQRILIDIQ